MSKILVFGPGFLGTKFHLSTEGSILSHADIADHVQICTALDEHHPDVVINFAGKTGKPNVDWCETNPLPTMRSNVVGALVLAEACAERGIHLTHIASGCVFYGPSPDPNGWREDDFANPSAFYSRTKYAADLVLSQLPNVAVVRLRMPIDSEPSPRNLIDKLAQYPKIVDVENSVTVVDDLLQAVKGIIEKRGIGIFHAVNPGVMWHRDLIALYEELVDPRHTNEWITEADLVAQGLVARKRSNNIMQNTRLPALDIHLRPINVALRDTMEKYALACRAIIH